MSFTRACAGLSLVILLTLHLPVQASPPFELVGSAVGSGGWNARVSGNDASAAYFNPARLSRAQPGIQLGWFVLNDAIQITLFARSQAQDIPVLALNQFQGKFPSLPTSWLQDGCDPMQGGRCASKLAPHPRQGVGSSGNSRVYQVFGLVSEVSPRWLTLGLYGMMPFDAFMQGHAFFSDEREQFFSNSLHPELYSDRLGAMALAFGASSQLLDWLSVGVGVTLSLTNSADAATYVGNSDMIAESLQLDTKIKVNTGVAPILSANLTPIEGLDIALTAHTPQKLEVATRFSTFLPNGNLQSANRTATLAWEPWKFGLGAQYDFLRGEAQRLGVAITATYALWSGYINRQSERPQQGYSWSNTLAIAVGLRHVYDKRLTSAIDAIFEPTPVPLQTGRTNYVDNDRYGIAGSLNYLFPVAEKISLRIGAQAQIHLLAERSQTKRDPSKPPYAGMPYSQLVLDEWQDGAKNSRDETIQESFGLQTNNPGWPGFSSKGLILGAGVNVALLY